jgi:hypothetical protein
MQQVALPCKGHAARINAVCTLQTAAGSCMLYLMQRNSATENRGKSTEQRATSQVGHTNMILYMEQHTSSCTIASGENATATYMLVMAC